MAGDPSELTETLRCSHMSCACCAIAIAYRCPGPGASDVILCKAAWGKTVVDGRPSGPGGKNKCHVTTTPKSPVPEYHARRRSTAVRPHPGREGRTPSLSKLRTDDVTPSSPRPRSGLDGMGCV